MAQIFVKKSAAKACQLMFGVKDLDRVPAGAVQAT